MVWRAIQTKTLSSLFSDLNSDMILLQETMCTSYQPLVMFSKFKPRWEFCVVDVSGLSGGLLAGWNPLLVCYKAFSSFAGIILKASIKGLSKSLTIFNCYGPYSHRTIFWDNVQLGGLLALPNLLLAGDLNFTLSSSEIWGQKTRIDPLTSYFSQLISSNNLVDLCMNFPGPTWRNGQAGEEGVVRNIAPSTDRSCSSGLNGSDPEQISHNKVDNFSWKLQTLGL